jgi:hypothetical protein
MSKAVTGPRRKALEAAVREAQALRADWREAVQHHELRVAAQFQELARRMRIRPKGPQAKGLPSAKDAEHIRALLAGVRVKPGKGRAKDLKHIERALAAAIERLPAE